MMDPEIIKKQCCTCKKLKPEHEFSFANKNNGQLHHRCKICHSKANKKYMARNNENIKNKKNISANFNRFKIDELKNKASCADCHKPYPSCVLEFDHRNPLEKFYNVCHLVANGYPWATVEIEIAKCDILCSNCHRIRTYNTLRERFGPKHQKNHNRIGNRKRYRKSGSLIVDIIKALPCVDCGIIYHIACMDFDHIDASVKNSDISKMLHDEIAIGQILLEISQCDLVCANCHAVRTYVGRNIL